jgi:hypothetical protein
MPEPRSYPTVYVGLWYRNDGQYQKKARWTFVDEKTRGSVGPIYGDKFDLLAAIDTFAALSGYTEKVNVRAGAVADAPKPELIPEPKKIPGGWYNPTRTAAEMWLSFLATVPPEPAELQRLALMRAFFEGFFSMAQVMYRVGEDDISGQEGVDWVERLRKECLEILRRCK